MENKDWREEAREEWSQEVDNEMPMVFIVDGEEQIAYWWLNKIDSLLKLKQEEIEKAMPEKKVSLIVMGFDGVTKKGVISEDGYEILCKEMEKRGYNQALDDLKPIISKILK